MDHVSTRRSNSRPGFTLAELLAVLVLLTIVGGLVAPMSISWFRSQRLGEGVDTLRTDWIKARTLAMDEGRPYRFQVLSDMTGYRLAPNEAQYWPEYASGVNAAPSGSDEEPGGWVYEQRLPEGIVFEPSGDAVNLGASNEPTWLFLPDGRAKLLDGDGIEHEHATLLLADPASGRRRQLMMRALTGHSKIVPWQGP
jgi:prepilin-type N-terminal cleavage/methylation domain-containing protein